MSGYIRSCPNCGREIKYKWKCDFLRASKKDSICKSCATSKSAIFKVGHNLNDSIIRNNSLDRLYTEISPQTFYWVGFIIADGSFYKSRFELSLSAKDKEHLEKFASYINYSNNIAYREGSNSYRISFNNKQSIVAIMNYYSINYSKTYNPVNFDSYIHFNKELLLSLLIGIVDGDGNIQNNGSKGANVISITTHKSWRTFYTKLLNVLNIPIHISEVKGANTITIRIFRREILLYIKHFIINNNLTVLGRKWNIIKEN